ncbi:MAG: hypothetical protein ACXAEU_18230 [Candidatus Hodarchaeales archaeon]|jgi:hypothetical protein
MKNLKVKQSKVSVNKQVRKKKPFDLNLFLETFGFSSSSEFFLFLFYGGFVAVPAALMLYYFLIGQLITAFLLQLTTLFLLILVLIPLVGIIVQNLTTESIYLTYRNIFHLLIIGVRRS